MILTTSISPTSNTTTTTNVKNSYSTMPKLSVYMFAPPTGLVQPTVSGFLAPRGFLEYGVFSVKTKMIPETRLTGHSHHPRS